MRFICFALLVLAPWLSGVETKLPPGWEDGLAPGLNLGLAAKYLNDAGLARDSDVWHVEDFETGAVVWPHKEGHKLTDLMKVSDQNAHLGKFCGIKTWPEGENGGAARYWLPQEAHQGPHPAYFLRAYRKFDAHWHPGDVKKKVGLKGMGICCLKSKFDGRGGAEAGGKSDGTDWYTAEDQFVGWEGKGAGSQNGYYWFGHCYSYSPFPAEAVAQPGKIKVNDPPTTRFSCYADPYLYIQYEKWYCFEIALYLNTPGQRDGEMRYWIDGVLQARVTHLCYRTVENALPEVVTLNLYRTTENFPQPMTLWMDDIVVARRYIGPAVEKPLEAPKAVKAPAPPPAPPKPAFDPAPHRAAVIQRLVAASSAVPPPAAAPVTLTILGQAQSVRAGALGKEGLVVEIQGNRLPLRWKDLNDPDMARLVRVFTPGDTEALYQAGILAAGARAEKLREEIEADLQMLDSEKAKALRTFSAP